jgi:hypothetical protein
MPFKKQLLHPNVESILKNISSLKNFSNPSFPDTSRLTGETTRFIYQYFSIQNRTLECSRYLEVYAHFFFAVLTMPRVKNCDLR